MFSNSAIPLENGFRVPAGWHLHLTLYLSIQPITLMGIDELHTSWLSSTEWRMSKLSLVIYT